MTSPSAFTSVTACRICGSAELHPIIDLGSQPLANRLLTADQLANLAVEPEPTFPLQLLLCGECGLLTLSVVVDPELMFADYRYATGVSEGLRRHFERYARDVAARLIPGGGRWVEIGSNDGTLLRGLPGNVEGIGVEPATNLAQAAQADGLNVVNAFFDAASAEQVRLAYGHADVITANNVFAHIHDLSGVAAGVDALLADDGAFIIEAPGSLELERGLAFDTLYHEHLSVLGLHPLVRWAQAHGWRVFDVEEPAVHGGSLRIFIDRSRRDVSERVGQRLQAEQAASLLDPKGWQNFSTRVRTTLDQIRDQILEANAAGQTCAAYGAAAKSTVLLCAAELPPGAIAFLCDKSPLKQGWFAPGTHLPIVPPERLAEDQPALCLLNAWNLADEIAHQQRGYLEAGGQFLVPLPEVRRLGIGDL